jgi:hypothetical protein
MSYSGDFQAGNGQIQSELPSQSTASQRQQRLVIGLLIVVGLAILAGGIYAIGYLLQNEAQTETLRDIFIIVLALEFMVIGLALVILLVQLAKLINLLQNEVRPILQSTSQAANTLRGTASFLSQNLVGPVMKVNSTIAAVRRAADMLNFGRRKD